MPAPTPVPPVSGPPSEATRGDEGAAGSRETASASAGSGAPPAPLPVAPGSLLLVGVGESIGRLLASVRPMENIGLLRIQSAGMGPEVFAMPPAPAAELLDTAPFLEELGLTEKTFDLELRCCAKALYLAHRAALLDRLRDRMKNGPIGTVVIVAEAATSLGATVLSELPLDLEALYARRLGQRPVLIRIPMFPVGGGEELERTTLYALSRELDAHFRGSLEESLAPHCENSQDELILSDFQVGTPAQRKDELVRFLGALAALFRSPGGVAAADNPIVQHPTAGPWRRSYRDLLSLWRGSSWTDFRRRRLLRELEAETAAPPLVDQEPFRAGRRLYQEMDARYRRLLAAGAYDYPARICPDDAGSYLELAEQLLADGRDRDAFDAFTAASEARADLPEALEGMGRTALLLGDVDEAMKDFTRAVQLDPCSKAGHEGILLSYLSAGRLENARKHLELATAAGCPIEPELIRRLR